jgi:hypothetical protein
MPFRFSASHSSDPPLRRTPVALPHGRRLGRPCPHGEDGHAVARPHPPGVRRHR